MLVVGTIGTERRGMPFRGSAEAAPEAAEYERSAAGWFVECAERNRFQADAIGIRHFARTREAMQKPEAAVVINRSLVLVPDAPL